MVGIAIRRLGPADAADYRAIRLATLLAEPAWFGTPHEAEAARPTEHFARVLADAAVFAACRDGAIVGVVRLQQAAGAKERHKASVHGFFVRPEARRAGVGAALMDAVVHEARRTVEQLVLSVAAGNAGAIALYRRWGFVPYGVEPRARKDATGYSDLVLMWRDLAT